MIETVGGVRYATYAAARCLYHSTQPVYSFGTVYVRDDATPSLTTRARRVLGAFLPYEDFHILQPQIQEGTIRLFVLPRTSSGVPLDDKKWGALEEQLLGIDGVVEGVVVATGMLSRQNARDLEASAATPPDMTPQVRAWLTDAKKLLADLDLPDEVKNELLLEYGLLWLRRQRVENRNTMALQAWARRLAEFTGFVRWNNSASGRAAESLFRLVVLDQPDRENLPHLPGQDDADVAEERHPGEPTVAHRMTGGNTWLTPYNWGRSLRRPQAHGHRFPRVPLVPSQPVVSDSDGSDSTASSWGAPSDAASEDVSEDASEDTASEDVSSEDAASDATSTDAPSPDASSDSG